MVEIPYATREYVMSSLEILDSAYAQNELDNVINAASRSAEGFLHGRFYPEQRTIYMDWPNNSYSPSWEVALGDQQLISLTSVISGGTDITADCFLRRSDDLGEPPYDILQVDLSTNSAFSAGDSWQRSLQITGLFGYAATDTGLAGASLSGGINSAVSSITLVPTSGIYQVGVGSLVQIDTERMLVIDRQMVSTGLTTSSSLLDIQSGRIFTCASASSFARGQVILIDSERMRIDDIAGTSILVTRAWDGTVLATHSSGATIYAQHTCIVRRGVLGTTAASHSDAAAVYVHAYPSILTELVRAETIVMVEQAGAGYARTTGTSGAGSTVIGPGIADIRDRAWQMLGRKNRSSAV